MFPAPKVAGEFPGFVKAAEKRCDIIGVTWWVKLRLRLQCLVRGRMT